MGREAISSFEDRAGHFSRQRAVRVIAALALCSPFIASHDVDPYDLRGSIYALPEECHQDSIDTLEGAEQKEAEGYIAAQADQETKAASRQDKAKSALAHMKEQNNFELLEVAFKAENYQIRDTKILPMTGLEVDLRSNDTYRIDEEGLEEILLFPYLNADEYSPSRLRQKLECHRDLMLNEGQLEGQKATIVLIDNADSESTIYGKGLTIPQQLPELGVVIFLNMNLEDDDGHSDSTVARRTLHELSIHGVETFSEQWYFRRIKKAEQLAYDMEDKTEKIRSFKSFPSPFIRMEE